MVAVIQRKQRDADFLKGRRKLPEDQENENERKANSSGVNAYKKLSSQKEVSDLIDKIWKKYDNDNSGALDVQELHAFLQEFYNDAQIEMHVFEFEVQDLIDEIDKSKDGKIQQPELLRFMCYAFGVSYTEKPRPITDISVADFEGSSSESSSEEDSSEISEKPPKKKKKSKK